MNADLNLTAAELAALLGEPAEPDVREADGDVQAELDEDADGNVRAIGTAVHALIARVEVLESLVRELRLQVIDRESSGPSIGSALMEGGRTDQAQEAAERSSDLAEPRLSRVERFGRRRG